MIALNHTLVGAAIGSEIDSVPVVVGLAVASHFVLDFLPHVDQGSELSGSGLKTMTKYFLAGVDIFASALVIILILMIKPNLNYTAVITGAVSALLVDLVFNVPFWEKWMKRTKPFAYVYRFHHKIHQPFEKYQYSIGIPLQILIIAFSVWLLLK